MYPKATRAALAAAGLSLTGAAPAFAQSLDETVNQIFAASTGWFVNFIFSPFPGTSFPWIVAWLVAAATAIPKMISAVPLFMCISATIRPKPARYISA